MAHCGAFQSYRLLAAIEGDANKTRALEPEFCFSSNLPTDSLEPWQLDGCGTGN